jgi:hypothetical protein
VTQRKARHPFKDEAERRFPHKVDIPVPGNGLGRDLTAMLDWCRARVPQPAWAYHGHTARPSKRAAPVHSARWYFLKEADAEAFRGRWLTERSQQDCDREKEWQP